MFFNYRRKTVIVGSNNRGKNLSTASPERGGGCAEGADGGVSPLVTMTDTEQQKKFAFDKYGT